MNQTAGGVTISGLSLAIGGVTILSGISFGVAPGEILYVIGRNGAGKSTLFKCIVGVARGFSGSITISGVDSRSLRARDRARLVAYVPQSSPGDVPYTVGEFLRMSRYPWRGVSSEAEDRRAVNEAMELTGTTELSERKMSSLSGGEKQKTMIASAMAQGASVILMDEPTTYLDYAHQVETMEVVARVNEERGVTMMIVTHDVNLAMGSSGVVVALADGRLLWTGEPRGLMEPGRLDEIYGVPFRQYRSDNPGDCPILAPERASL
ncbi:iron-hydroxamate transporter ATP-binding protein [Synergistales bacterium]|nr:iron-hydroxamate transporter ATP-binding protein [Synergistales bacterium]